MKKEKLLVPFIAASVLVGASVATPVFSHSAYAASSVSVYQKDVNSLADYYAPFYKTVEKKLKEIEGIEDDEKALTAYDQLADQIDQFLTKTDKNYAMNHLNSEADQLQGYLYDSLIALYNYIVDLEDYAYGDVSDAEFNKISANFEKEINAYNTQFQQKAKSYKTKRKVTFNANMSYLLDEDIQPSPTAPSTPADSNGTYTVKKGDTLTAVAKKYGMTVAELKKLNNLKTDALKVGQVLKVKSTSASSPAPAPQASVSAKQQQIVSYAKTLIGKPYKYGGTTPKGFDVSGYTQYVYKNAGSNISIPRTVADQYKSGTDVKQNSLQAGDLVFFKNGKSVSVVGIYLDKQEFIYVSSKGVKTQSLSTAYWKNSYAGAKRIIK
ncbi:C40 family peptidase [Priestia megaterium]|uniref:C40 family peptidase n=1 Tax=Priestia megaterium TaxID=1404 RepID=UPI000BF4E48C|nr:C40 family peptidase [Priestia megaterium]MBM6600070.1 C40 family peptidase [Priestia megaterium]MDP1439103.1 NlpC/P60 family protein [Priestia megaterium]MDP1468120.1 NlpC/P60 family protein [Priestia megaterium]MDR0129706.1 NlpC/P60 family protein [Priestia megaterium]MDR4220857.1 LysM peptidoglycan-binding domain-containing protein [Priestia megaterium]